MPTKPELADFSAYARNPDTWLLGARRQLAVAELLFDRVGELRSQASKFFEEFSGCHYASFMHAGFAVENAVKAVLIARDPTIVLPNGALDAKKLGPKGGHGLRALVTSVLPDLTKEDQDLLLKLEEHVIWAGRYTVPMKAAVLYDDNVMNVLRQSPADERSRLRALVTRLIQAV
jgi:hypothetical protein